jgi:hypothetical protein
MAKYSGVELTKKELLKRVGNVSQLASIRPYGINQGKAAGLKAFDVNTGSGLDFTVLESKCLDIYDMKYKGMNINFITKPGLVSPEFFIPHGFEFLRTFQGGMLYTCGLSNVGSPCTEDGKEYSLHGRIGSTPAEKARVAASWQDDEYIIEISGEMREAALFNENLVLRRTIYSKLGEKSVRIHDEVENQGFEEQVLMLLYHFNLGYPILDEGSRFVTTSAEVLPRDKEAERGIVDYMNFCTPVDQYPEQVFYHKPASDSSGNTYAALINDRLEIGVYIKFNISQLPNLIQWKSMRSGDYVLGIEPANCLVEGRVKERERGTIKTIAPFETSEFDLEIGILEGKVELEAFGIRLKALL